MSSSVVNECIVKHIIMAKRENLFSEFAPNTMQEWVDKVTVDLKGADFNKKLMWRTNEGFNVQPMYRLEDMAELKNLQGYPGEYPFVRGNKKDNNSWYVRQNIAVTDYAAANQKALDVLNRGVDSLGFVMAGCGVSYTKADVGALLNGICLECIEVNFEGVCAKSNFLESFIEYVAEKGYTPEKINGGIKFDPIGKATLKGKFNPECANVLKAAIEKTAAYPNFKVVEVGGHIFNNSGSSVVQELGFALAAGVEYLDLLTDAGLSIDQIAPKVRFHFATGSKYFMEIAKLRAARYLWAQIVKGYNPCCDCKCMMHIYSETSKWNKSAYDPNVNMLRTQTEAMSAVLGGVESYLVNPFDCAYQTPSELAERVARNQQLLLKEESHFEKVADVAGGSYYIEELTEMISEGAWKLFLQVQEKGGYIAALKSGFVQAAVNETAKARDLAIAQRKESYVGVNQFPNFNEVIAELSDEVFQAEDCTVEDAEFETLKPYRGVMAFEAMRNKTDKYAAQNGRPLVYMFPMGNLAMRKARAQFACNFFACAGFEVKDNNGFATVEEGVQACLAENPAIVVVCSSDDEYAGFAPEVYEALKEKAIIVVAGNPECRAELEAKGLTNYIHVKNNVLEELKGYQQKLGI